MRELPNRVHRLNDLANDLWWSWNRTARNVFRRLDYALWRQTAHNPVKMLSAISNDALARAVASTDWLHLYDEAVAGLDAAHTSRNTWCAREHPSLAASLNGDRFISDPQTPLGDDDRVLIVSSDAGG